MSLFTAHWFAFSRMKRNLVFVCKKTCNWWQSLVLSLLGAAVGNLSLLPINKSVVLFIFLQRSNTSLECSTVTVLLRETTTTTTTKLTHVDCQHDWTNICNSSNSTQPESELSPDTLAVTNTSDWSVGGNRLKLNPTRPCSEGPHIPEVCLQKCDLPESHPPSLWRAQLWISQWRNKRDEVTLDLFIYRLNWSVNKTKTSAGFTERGRIFFSLRMFSPHSGE